MIIDIRNIRFSEKFRKDMGNECRQSSDDNVNVITGILSVEPPLDVQAFNNKFNKLLDEYTQLYDKTHPLQINIPISNKLKEFIRDVEYVRGALGIISEELQKSRMNEDDISHSFTMLRISTNRMRDYSEIFIALKYKQEPLKKDIPKKNTNFFKKLLVGLGIITTIGTGIAVQKNVAASEPDKHTIGNVDMRAMEKAKAQKVAAEKEAEIKRLKEIEISKKLEEERIKVLKAEYHGVSLKRKDVISQVNKILSRMKMPASYMTPRHVKALIWAESRFNPETVSSAHAYGLMQVLSPSSGSGGTSDDYRFNIYKNVEAGMKILKEKERYCRHKHPNWDKLSNDEKMDIIFAAYNCGGTKLSEEYGWNIYKSNNETISHMKTIHDYLKYN